MKSLIRHHHVRPTISTEKSRTRFVENMFERTPIRHHVAHPQLQTGFCCPNESFWEISLCGGDSDLAGSRVNPHVPRLPCGQAAESAESKRKAQQRKILQKRGAAAPAGARCPLEAFCLQRNENLRAEPRRLSCAGASVPALPTN